MVNIALCSNAVYAHWLPHETKTEVDQSGIAKIEAREKQLLGMTSRVHTTLVTLAIFGASICQRAVGISVGKTTSESIPFVFSMASFAVGALFEVQAGGATIRLRALSMLVGLFCLSLLAGIADLLASST